MKKVIAQLSPLGYRHLGDLGIAGRETLGRMSEKAPIIGTGREWPPHHLYACLEGSTGLRNHLLFRDYLRAHPAKVAEYAQLKKQLAARFPTRIDQYIAGKTVFITTVLKEAGLSQAEIDQIIEQNRVK